MTAGQHVCGFAANATQSSSCEDGFGSETDDPVTRSFVLLVLVPTVGPLVRYLVLV